MTRTLTLTIVLLVPSVTLAAKVKTYTASAPSQKANIPAEKYEKRAMQTINLFTELVRR